MRNRKKLVSILAGILAAMLLLSLLLSLIPVASAASSSEIRNQINDLKTQQGQIRDQMNDIREQYEKNEDEIADLVARKAVIDQEIFLLLAEIDNINQQISSYALLIADKQDELDEALARYNALSAEYRDRIRVMEEEGTMSYWEVLFKASSFSDLLDRLNMIQEIAASDRRRLEALTDAANQVEQARNELQQEKQELEETRASLDAVYGDLSAKQAEAQELLTELMEKAEELEGLYESFEEEESALLTEIAKKEQEYNDAKYQEWLAHIATATTATTAPPETTKPAGSGGETEEPGGETEPEETTQPTDPAPATWIRPCTYVMLTSPFGYRDAPTAGASTYHQGVDLAGPEGTPIYASRAGTVTIASRSNSAGYYVTINHGDGFSSVYMHLTNYVVSAGTKVAQGQLIGYMGNTGISTGPHLHFGIAYNGTYVNPALYVPLY